MEGAASSSFHTGFFGKLSVKSTESQVVLHPVGRPQQQQQQRGQVPALVVDRDTLSVAQCQLEALERVGLDLVKPVEQLWGILGKLQFTTGVYLVGVSGAKRVGVLAGKRIFQATNFRFVLLSGRLAQLSEDEQSDLEEYRKFLESFEFHFSPDYDFTRSMQSWQQQQQQQQQKQHNPPAGGSVGDGGVGDGGVRPVHSSGTDVRFFWNEFLARDFLTHHFEWWILRVTDAFVRIEPAAELAGRRFLYALISRRSKFRTGVRFHTRGADPLGHVANFVETEQIVECNGVLSSFVQIRGSIPIIWHQKGSGGKGKELKPRPIVSYAPLWRTSFNRHLEVLQRLYGGVIAVNLIDKNEREGSVGEAFETAVRLWNFEHPKRAFPYVWYDFHALCAHNRYENLVQVVESVRPQLEAWKFYLQGADGSASQVQTGVVRTNCIDCLDRTNVVQSVVGHYVLERQLNVMGLLQRGTPIETHVVFESMLKNLWADNADVMSRRYTGVGALKTDFTRTGKRTGKGLISDGINSVRRVAQHVFKDAGKQENIDRLLGNISLVSRTVGQDSAERRVFIVSRVKPALEEKDARVFIQRRQAIYLVFDCERRTMTRFSYADCVQIVLSLDRIYSVSKSCTHFSGIRIVFDDRADAFKYYFPSALQRQQFCDFLVPLLPSAAVPQHCLRSPADRHYALNAFVMTWRSPFGSQGPGEQRDVHALFRSLPTDKDVVVIALQDTWYKVPPEEPLIQDRDGYPAYQHFYYLIQCRLGAGYERVALTTSAGAALCIFVRRPLLPFVTDVETRALEVVDAAPERNSSNTSSAFSPSKSGGGLFGGKSGSALKNLKGRLAGTFARGDNLSGSAAEGVGCGVVLEMFDSPLCFLSCNSNVPAGARLSALRFASSKTRDTEPFNVVSDYDLTVWAGSMDPSLYAVDKWLCLASNHQLQGHILSFGRGISGLLSSDPPAAGGAAANPAVSGSRGVAALFQTHVSVPGLSMTQEGTLLEFRLWNIRASGFAPSASSRCNPYLSFHAPWLVGGRVQTEVLRETSAPFWRSTCVLRCFVTDVAYLRTRHIMVELWNEASNAHIACGTLELRDALAVLDAPQNSPAYSFELELVSQLNTANGSLNGNLRCSTLRMQQQQAESSGFGTQRKTQELLRFDLRTSQERPQPPRAAPQAPRAAPQQPPVPSRTSQVKPAAPTHHRSAPAIPPRGSAAAATPPKQQQDDLLLFQGLSVSPPHQSGAANSIPISSASTPVVPLSGSLLEFPPVPDRSTQQQQQPPPPQLYQQQQVHHQALSQQQQGAPPVTPVPVVTHISGEEDLLRDLVSDAAAFQSPNSDFL